MDSFNQCTPEQVCDADYKNIHTEKSRRAEIFFFLIHDRLFVADLMLRASTSIKRRIFDVNAEHLMTTRRAGCRTIWVEKNEKHVGKKEAT